MSTLPNPVTIVGYINSAGFLYRYFLQNKWIFISALFHESQHFFGIHTDGEEKDPAKRLLHFVPYYNQFAHSSFMKTPSEFRRTQWFTFKDYYLNYLQNIYPNECKIWKAKFLALDIPEVK